MPTRTITTCSLCGHEHGTVNAESGNKESVTSTVSPFGDLLFEPGDKLRLIAEDHVIVRPGYRLDLCDTCLSKVTTFNSAVRSLWFSFVEGFTSGKDNYQEINTAATGLADTFHVPETEEIPADPEGRVDY
jgi:hypothetical protein